MEFPRRTQGATLVVSLLFVMLILAVIMAVTAQVTLSTRRSSADQQRVLAARYAAESGVAQIQARLRTMKALLDRSSIPPTVGNSVVDARIRDLCGVTVLPAATATGTPVCTFPATGLSDSAARVGVFDLAVSGADFARQGFLGTTAGDRARYWRSMFSGTAQQEYTGSGADGSTYRASFGLVPTELRRFPDGYRLAFTVPSVTSQGVTPLTTQRIRARATTDGAGATYALRIARPSFAKYALFTNHHYQSEEAEGSGLRINFTPRTLFSGPVHTNQNFLFDGDATGQPVFWGPVTSAGCPAGRIGPVTTDGTVEEGCTVPEEQRQQGGYFDYSAQEYVDHGSMSPSDQAPVRGDNAPQFNSTVRWDAGFVRLPVNNQNQNAAAQLGGLYFTGDVTELRLYRDEIAGVERQRVTYTQGGTTTQLSYGQDGRLWILSGGVWVAATRSADQKITAGTPQATFNGVISVEGGDVQDLNGGPNAGQPLPAGASIASFAGVTVAASGTVNITSSLKYTDPPCTGENTDTAPAPCDNLNATNILGVYSSGGNVDLISPHTCPGEPGSCPSLNMNPEIDAVLMASQGAVQVKGFDQGPPLGRVKLLGGVIENYYGAFGQFNAGGATHGYGRNFVYDQRTADGYTPPAFPTQQDWTISLSVALPDGSEKKLDPDDGGGIRLQGDSVAVGEGGS